MITHPCPEKQTAPSSVTVSKCHFWLSLYRLQLLDAFFSNLPCKYMGRIMYSIHLRNVFGAGWMRSMMTDRPTLLNADS